MAQNKIPTAVLQEAKRLGCTPVYEGVVDGTQIYNLFSESDGHNFPTGLPVYLSYKGGHVAIIEDIDALILMRRLSQAFSQFRVD